MTDDPAGLAALALPDGLVLARTTPEFTAESVPAGLLGAHRVADDVWGRLCVFAGTVAFVVEATGRRRLLAADDTQVIEPGLLHHVEPSADARFAVEFHRPPESPPGPDPG